MATNSRDIKLTLGVKTTGTEDVQQLASDLEGVATAGKAAELSGDPLPAVFAKCSLCQNQFRTMWALDLITPGW
jgi:hypothetical protein